MARARAGIQTVGRRPCKILNTLEFSCLLFWPSGRLRRWLALRASCLRHLTFKIQTPSAVLRTGWPYRPAVFDTIPWVPICEGEMPISPMSKFVA